MKRGWLAASVVVSLVWVSSTAYAFWYFQGQHLGAYPESQTWMAFQADGLPVPADAGQVRLTLFWDDVCPCSRYSEPHARELIEMALARDESLLVIVPHGRGREQAASRFPDLPQDAIHVRPSPVEGFVSPSAAVHDRRGDLVYAGPLGEGAGCVTDADGFLDSALAAVRAGDTTAVINTTASGCFCPWRS